MDDFTLLRSLRSGRPIGPVLAGRVPCVVAIPVRDEAEAIGRCLAAIHATHRTRAALVQTTLLLNGCTDATWDTVATWAQSSDLPVHMVEVNLGASVNHAGGARALALRVAADGVAGHGNAVLLTTDADSQVPLDWLDRAVTGLDAGCDVMAGDFDVDPASEAFWPASLRGRVTLEATYSRLLDEVDARCDPLPHNPWPTHRRCSGANLAFTASALAALDSVPAPPCGEDRALVAAFIARGLRVRHDPLWRVQTSARLHGRAAGGMAETLRFRSACLEAPCDPLLEAFDAHLHRATLRARLRQTFHPGLTPSDLARRARLSLTKESDVPCRHFGDAWLRLEDLAPALQRVPLLATSLPGEIEQAHAWLSEREPIEWTAEVAA